MSLVTQTLEHGESHTGGPHACIVSPTLTTMDPTPQEGNDRRAHREAQSQNQPLIPPLLTMGLHPQAALINETMWVREGKGYRQTAVDRPRRWGLLLLLKLLLLLQCHRRLMEDVFIKGNMLCEKAVPAEWHGKDGKSLHPSIVMDTLFCHHNAGGCAVYSGGGGPGVDVENCIFRCLMMGGNAAHQLQQDAMLRRTGGQVPFKG